MKIPAYVVEGVVNCVYDTELSCIYVKWDRFVPAHVRPCLEAHWAPLSKHGGKGVIVDTKHSKGALSIEDQQWLVDVFFPKMAKIGVRAIVTIVPESAVTRISAKNWSQSGEVAGIKMINAATYEDALDAMASI
jgi:hypothetical protein